MVSTQSNEHKSNVTILVVDDDDEMRQAIVTTLKRAGYNVLEGKTGTEVLVLVRQHHPPLLLLDVALPDSDGRDIARQIKSDPELHDVFVILLSGTKISPDDQLKGMQEGLADGYIIHPIPPKVLAGWVEAFLRLYTTQQKLHDIIRERDALILELQQALEKIKTLKGLIPICAACKKIRNDKGFWESFEKYITTHTDAELTHGICPDCAEKLYGVSYNDILSGKKDPK